MTDTYVGTEPLLEFHDQDPARLSELAANHPLVGAIKAIAASVLPSDVATTVEQAAAQVQADLAASAQQASISAALTIVTQNMQTQASTTLAGAIAAETGAQTAEAAAIAAEAAAATSQGAASTSAGQSATSAAASLVSANNSAASATASSGSAAASAASASTAQGYAATLAASIASFNKLWLGPHATDPTTDNSGAALQEGAEYENTSTTPAKIRVYHNGAWQDQSQDAETASSNATLAATQAGASATAAATSATASATSATNSANSATASANSATASDTARAASVVAQNASSTSAAASAASATGASGSAASAQAWATQLGSMVGGVDYSAKFYANQSAASATAAAQSAATAQVAATGMASQTQVQNNSLTYTTDTGAANAYVVAYTPAIGALTDGMVLSFNATNANTGASTLAINGLPAKAIVGNAHAALTGGEIIANGRLEVMWDAALNAFILLENTGGASQLAAGSYSVTPALGDTSTKVANMTAIAQAVAALPYAGRNRILNGAMRVAQRSAATVSGSNSLYGGPDAVQCTVASSGATIIQQASSLSYGGVLRPCAAQSVSSISTTLAAGNYNSGFTFHIEGNDAYDLLGGAIGVSFIFQASVAGSYTATLRDASGTWSYSTLFNIAASNTAQYISYTIPKPPAGPTAPIGNAIGLMLRVAGQNNGTFLCPTGSLNQWVNANYLAAQGNTAWSATASAIIAITDVQVEPGPPTTFERIPLWADLAKCQRRFQGAQVNWYSSASAASQNLGDFTNFIVPMRAAPTVTTLSTGTVSNCGQPSVSTTSAGYQVIAVSSAAGAVQYVNYNYGFSADF